MGDNGLLRIGVAIIVTCQTSNRCQIGRRRGGGRLKGLWR